MRLTQKRRACFGYVGTRPKRSIALRVPIKNLSEIPNVVDLQRKRLVDDYTPQRQVEFVEKGISVQPSVGGAYGAGTAGLKGVSPFCGCEGEGLNLAGRGLNVAGGGLNLAGRGLNVAGGGLNLAGGALVEGVPLPGEELREKLLKKMTKKKKMTAMGDRVKTKPISQGYVGKGLNLAGGGLNIPATSSGQSRSKTLEDTQEYELNPQPLIGAGIDKKVVVEYLKDRVIPILKKEGLIPIKMKNSMDIKKLIGAKVSKLIKQGEKDPLELIKKLITKLKPIMKTKKGQGLKLAGSGVLTTINKVAAKILAGLFRMGNPSSPIAKGFDYLGKGQDGGFVFSIAAIIAAVSAAASAAASTAIAGTTVGALAGSFLTGAAGVAGSAAMKKILENPTKEKKFKKLLRTLARKAVISIKDMSKEDKKMIMKEIKILKQNPTKEGLQALAMKLAPKAKKLIMAKISKRLSKILKMKGKGLRLAGSGLKLAGQGKFDKDFAKLFKKHLVK